VEPLVRLRGKGDSIMQTINEFEVRNRGKKGKKRHKK
jgi:hypothetical protein